MNHHGYSEHHKSSYRRIQSRRTFYIWFSISSSFLIAFLGLLYIIMWSPFLRVQSFEIVNTNLATPLLFLKTAVVAETLRSAPWWKGVVGPNNILFWLFELKHDITAA